MGIKTYRPVTPTLRFQTSLTTDDLTTSTPHKPLLTTCASAPAGGATRAT